MTTAKTTKDKRENKNKNINKHKQTQNNKNNKTHIEEAILNHHAT